MSFYKPLNLSIVFAGWTTLGQQDIMAKDDVCVLFKQSDSGIWLFKHPGEINYGSWDKDEGFIIEVWAGSPVSQMSATACPDKHKDFFYAMFRSNSSIKKGRREYKPSRWADPVPLP